MEILTEDQLLLVEGDRTNTVVEREEVSPVLIEDCQTVVIQKEEVETVYIGAVGPQGPGGVIGELQFNTIVAPTEKRAIDSVSTELVDSVLWEVVLIDRTLNRKHSAAVRGLESEGAVSHIIGPRNGADRNTMPHLIEVELIGTELILYVTNNHSNNFIAEVLRIKTNKAQI